MNEKIKSKIVPVFSACAVICIVLSVISAVALGSGAVMRFLGFQYQSLFSIILYFVIFAVLGLPMELIAKGLPRALLYLKRISVNSAKILFVVMDVAATTIAMITVDYFMDSVSASNISIFAVALILCLFSLGDFDDKLRIRTFPEK